MWGFSVGSLFCGVVLGLLSSLANILLRKRELVALHCVVTGVAILCSVSLPLRALCFLCKFRLCYLGN